MQICLFCQGFGAWAEEGSPVILESAMACFLQCCLVLGNLLLLAWVSVQLHAETMARRMHPRADVVVLATRPTRIDGWIARFQHAARSRSYVGTLVASTSDGTMSCARITHACSDKKQLEHIESLAGVLPITYRWGHEFHTFLPQSHRGRRGHLYPAEEFLSLASAKGAAVVGFYHSVYQGTDAGRADGRWGVVPAQ